MDPEQPKGGDNFLPIDFHEQLDDEGNYIGEPFVPEAGEPLDNEEPLMNDGLEEDDEDIDPRSPEGLRRFARK